MGIGLATAILLAGGAAAGASIFATQQSKKGRKKATPLGTNVKPTTPRDVTKKSARSAIVAGSPQGILSPSATSGRGTLLGN